MIKPVSIYHHVIPSAGFGGADFCCVNVNHEVACSLVRFLRQKKRDQMQRCAVARRWHPGGDLQGKPAPVPFRKHGVLG